MKKHLLTLALFIGISSLFNLNAINPTVPEMMAEAAIMAPTMTVNDFLDMDIKGYRTVEGKKMKWTHRLALGATQKNLAKKVKKGKVDGEASLSSAMAVRGANTYGLLSVIFAVAGLVIPYLGIAMIIAGLVLGIIGISRDANPTLAIIGTVISSVFLLLLLIVIIAISSWNWF